MRNGPTEPLGLMRPLPPEPGVGGLGAVVGVGEVGAVVDGGGVASAGDCTSIVSAAVASGAS
jgi:hypothetical protein